MNIHINKKRLLIYIFLIVAILICWSIFGQYKNEFLFFVVNFVSIVIICFLIIIDIKMLYASSSIKLIVLLGFLLRMAVVVVSVLYAKEFSTWFNMGDQESFFSTALNYYRGNYSTYMTRYPYFINFVFGVFGPYRLMVQVLNVVCWYMGLKLIYKMADRDLHGRPKELIVGFYSILPMQILITASMLRESIMIYCLMLSLLYLCRWQQTGKRIHILLSIILAVPAILLHTGCIALWGTILIVYVLWSEKFQRWRKITYRTVLLLIVVLFFVPIYENIIVVVFPDYLSTHLSIETLTSRAYDQSRADYVLGSGVATNIVEFIAYSVYRIFYFWVSPTPRFWSSLFDVIAFAFDTVPWLIFMYCYCKQLKRNNNYIHGRVGIILFVIFSLIYAWGTRNAGTAMRHRDMLMGPMSMIMIYGYNSSNKYLLKR